MVIEQSEATATIAATATGIPAVDTKAAEQVPDVGHEKPGDQRPAPLAVLPEPNYPAYLYWNLTDPRGVLHRYETRAVSQRLVLQVPRRLVQKGEVLRIYFKGYTGTYSE